VFASDPTGPGADRHHCAGDAAVLRAVLRGFDHGGMPRFACLFSLHEFDLMSTLSRRRPWAIHGTAKTSPTAARQMVCANVLAKLASRTRCSRPSGPSRRGTGSRSADFVQPARPMSAIGG